jgi:hypothetical protein
LACPYWKHDPERYSERNLNEKPYRGCASCYTTTISRLKQHLYRVHRRPDHYCARCFRYFDTKKELDDHNREDPSCQIAGSPFEEKMTADQMIWIKRRQPGKDQSETWFDIFGSLFPGAPLPSTPYVESIAEEAVRSFVRLFQSEAPIVLSELIRDELQETLLLRNDQQSILDGALDGAISELVRLLGSNFSTRTARGSMLAAGPTQRTDLLLAESVLGFHLAGGSQQVNLPMESMMENSQSTAVTPYLVENSLHHLSLCGSSLPVYASNYRNTLWPDITNGVSDHLNSQRLARPWPPPLSSTDEVRNFSLEDCLLQPTDVLLTAPSESMILVPTLRSVEEAPRDFSYPATSLPQPTTEYIGSLSTSCSQLPAFDDSDWFTP